MTAATPPTPPAPRRGLGLADSERENALLAGVVEAISSGPDLGPLAARIAGLVGAATGTDVCFVHVLDDGGGALTLAGATPPFDVAVGRVRLLVGEGVSGWVARNSEPVTITDGMESDPRYRYFPELRGEEFTSMASVPMASGLSGLAGVLTVHTRSRRIFSERDVVLLTRLVPSSRGRSSRPGCTAGWPRASTRTNGSPSG